MLACVRHFNIFAGTHQFFAGMSIGVCRLKKPQSKCKDKIARCLFKHHVMKTYGELWDNWFIHNLGTRWR
jgi:hypothetical protein